VFDGRIGKCVAAPPVTCGPMVGSKCPPPCVPKVVCMTKNNPCRKQTICVAPAPPEPHKDPVRPPRRPPAPVVTVARVTRPLPGVPGGEIVEGGEAPPA
jgi:hypothetical protein